MVQKTRKRGHHDLNTGRTLRREFFSKKDRKYAFVSCASTAASPAAVAAVRERLGVMGVALPPDGVEYSLNKRGRWTIADRIHRELIPALTYDSSCQVELYQHHHRPFARPGSSCTAFSSHTPSHSTTTTTALTVVQRSAERYMNAASLSAIVSGQATRRQRKRSLRQERRRRDSQQPLQGMPGGQAQQAKATVGGDIVRVVCNVVHSVPSTSSAYHPSEHRVSRLRTLPTSNSRRNIDNAADFALPRGRSVQECLADLHGAPADCCRPTAADYRVSDEKYIVSQIDRRYDDDSNCSRWTSSQTFLFNLGDAISVAQAPRWKPRAVSIPSAIVCSDSSHGHRREASLTKIRRNEFDVAAAPAATATAAVAVDATVSGGAALLSFDDRRDRTSALLPVVAMSAGEPPLAVRSSATGLHADRQPPCIRLRGGHEEIKQHALELFGEQWEECDCVPALVTVPLAASDTSEPTAKKGRQSLLPSELRPVDGSCLVLQQQLAEPALYWVWLATGSGTSDVEAFRELQDGAEYSAKDLLAAAAAATLRSHSEATSRRGERLLARSSHDPSFTTTFSILKAVRKWDVESKSLEETYRQIAGSEVDARYSGQQNDEVRLTVRSASKMQNVRDWPLSDDPVVCDICLTDARHPKERAFSLAACGHVCCFTCWHAYVMGAIAGKNGALQCPAYQCSTPLSHSLIVALCGVAPAMKHRRRLMEAVVWRHMAAAWCPNEHCGRVLTVATGRTGTDRRSEPFASVCCSACGRTSCIACKEEAHWPLTCRQATAYRERLRQRGLLAVKSASDFLAAVRVATKPCPACRYPIEKAEGCPQMHCVRCSAEFCWNCLSLLPPADRFFQIEHINACLAAVADDGQGEEFAATSAWSKRSALSGKAMRHRAYRSTSVSAALGKKLASFSKRVKARTISSYAISTGCAAATASYDEQLKSAIDRLRSVVLESMLEAHCIAECSLACLALSKAGPAVPQHRGGTVSAGGGDAKLLGRRAVAEIGRLEFTLERLEGCIMQLGDRSDRAPDLRHLTLIDDLAAAGKRQLLSLVRLMTVYQGYCWE